MPIVEESSFVPAWWLRNAHLQTSWPTLARRLPAPPLTRERLATPDGDFLDLDWYAGNVATQPTDTPAPIVLLLHGLAGSARSPYIQGMQTALARRGWRGAALNFRGCSGQPNLTSRCYHSGETGDVRQVYRHLRAVHPQAPLAVVGYSLGGNVVLKWLGEEGAKLDLCAAVAVSAPLRLDRCADRLDAGLSKIYRDRLLRELKDYLRWKQAHLRRIGNEAEWERLARLGDLSAVRSFWEYDDKVVASLYGFEDVHDYYRRSSSRAYLHAITVPTLIIQARDDPFMTPDVLPTAEELSPGVELEITKGGGHVGFIDGVNPNRPGYWLERRIPEYLAQRFGNGISRHESSDGTASASSAGCPLSNAAYS